ncbi:FtsK/SpoIIIE family DNA translocase [Flintibacter faecis]|uniref:DNA translocase FtsK 4TM domain-containing protein n=1 Tax=Flintibacter faecis TaxID=2763047 RepID=A0A8J6IZH5_9FIRM|nr:DNA translocase FtsK [Flintibacter faecis]MBC5717518.1 DNA translocase FtsK 4TM domain-containing protein [Flintibacter faecis]
MATKKKSSGGSRTASGGSRAASGSRSSGGKRTTGSGSRASSSRSGPAKRQTAPAPKPFRREVGALVCLLLAIFAAFGYFHMKALFIDLFCALLKGLLGYGFWLMPPALVLCAYILAFHRGRPVALRLCCALALPLALSVMLHGLLGQVLPWDAALLKALWTSGEELKSGGALGGLLGQGFVSLFTKVGCTIVCVLCGFFLALAACNRSVVDVAEWLFDRPQYEYEPKPERPRRREAQQAPAQAAASSCPSRRAEVDIDIPVDDGPLVAQSRRSAPPPEKKKSFFDRKPRVPSPDQLLAGHLGRGQTQSDLHPEPEHTQPADMEPMDEPIPVTPEELTLEPEDEPAFLSQPIYAPQDPAPAPQPEPEPVFAPVSQPAPAAAAAPPRPLSVQPSPHVPEPSAPLPVPEEPETVSKGEVAQQAAQVAQDIQGNLGQTIPPYQYPPLSLLTEGPAEMGGQAMAELNANRQRLTDTIHSFGIDANIVNVTRGPSVTRYELELDQGVRLNKLTNLADDIALSLGATGVRIAPIPDQISMVGIEVPNKAVTPVNIHSVIGSKAFTDSASKVSFAVGKDIGGNPIVGNIAKMPHLLIAGTTGSGKSVCTNSIITSLLYKATPEEVRLIMVDPKMVELGIYNGIPHLLIPVVTDPKKAAGALQWAVTEMMKRYRTFSEVGVRKLEEYNALAARTEGMEKMPYIVVLIDELADLMLVAAKEVEESICRVAQMGRAAGMHLIIATQRPSADVITGLMKANIPSRIAFAVASSLESRIILDITGAEKLVGRGDMLYFPLGSGKPTRVQGCLISDQEVASVVNFVKKSGAAQYDDDVMREIEQHAAEKEKGSKGVGGSAPDDVDGEFDELIDAAAEVVVETGQASVSMLQRRLKLGYARAARLVDQLEEKGIVGPFEGSKPRQLLITKEQWQELKYRQGVVSDPPPQSESAAVSPAAPAPMPPASDPPPWSDAPSPLDRTEEDTL